MNSHHLIAFLDAITLTHCISKSSEVVSLVSGIGALGTHRTMHIWYRCSANGALVSEHRC